MEELLYYNRMENKGRRKNKKYNYPAQIISMAGHQINFTLDVYVCSYACL